MIGPIELAPTSAQSVNEAPPGPQFADFSELTSYRIYQPQQDDLEISPVLNLLLSASVILRQVAKTWFSVVKTLMRQRKNLKLIDN